jgi:hypothetical protein
LTGLGRLPRRVVMAGPDGETNAEVAFAPVEAAWSGLDGPSRCGHLAERDRLWPRRRAGAPGLGGTRAMNLTMSFLAVGAFRATTLSGVMAVSRHPQGSVASSSLSSEGARQGWLSRPVPRDSRHPRSARDPRERVMAGFTARPANMRVLTDLGLSRGAGQHVPLRCAERLWQVVALSSWVASDDACDATGGDFPIDGGQPCL